MLWKHPLFSGTTKDRDVTPKLELDDFEVVHDREKDRLLVSGKVKVQIVETDQAKKSASTTMEMSNWPRI